MNGTPGAAPVPGGSPTAESCESQTLYDLARSAWRLEQQLAANVALIQAGEFWLGCRSLVQEARRRAPAPKAAPPRKPQLVRLLGLDELIADARARCDLLEGLLRYQHGIQAAQRQVARESGLGQAFAAWMDSQREAVRDWFDYDPQEEQEVA